MLFFSVVLFSFPLTLMQPVHAVNDVIDNRYCIVRELGRGGTGVTYMAESLENGQKVALKELSLKGLKDWKQIERFEREARTLEGLNHPAIPDYVDYFQVDTADNRLFYLAQEIAAGTSLADLVESGWRADEVESRRIAESVLEVLDYLHTLNPPVIHRDIKPQNIIRRDDGHIYLVDFGAVQTVYRDTLSQGSTVVGTYGYMAPEQFRGQAVPATDVYGLGATLLFLLTHQSPADLPQKRLRIDFRPYISVSDAFADWLDQMIDPLVEDRFATAREAITALTQPPTSAIDQSSGQPLAPRRPAGTRVHLQKSQTQLFMEIPPTGFRGETLGIGLFALFWNGGILVWTLGAISSGAPLVFALFSVPFWFVGLGLLGGIFNSLFGRAKLEIGPQRFLLERQLLGWTGKVEGNSADLSGVELRTAYTRNGRPVQSITLVEGVNTHKLGTPLTFVEKAWLVNELDTFVKQLPQRHGVLL
jgi:hypothetical protein